MGAKCKVKVQTRKLSEAWGKGYAFKIYGNDRQHEIRPNTTCNSWETILFVKKETKC